MRVVIAGAHGKVGLRLGRLLAERDDKVFGLVRNPEQHASLSAAGVTSIPFDLESMGPVELSEHLGDADAVVFAAGAGPGSGAKRKDTVDRAGAALLAEAAERSGVRRYLMIGSMGVGDDPDWEPPADADEVFAAYLRAKAVAERDLRSRPLDWTILRSGKLSDAPGTGKVRLERPPLPRGELSRDDVAALLVALLDQPGSIGLTLDAISGDTLVPDAVLSVLPSIDV